MSRDRSITKGKRPEYHTNMPPLCGHDPRGVLSPSIHLGRSGFWHIGDD